VLANFSASGMYFYTRQPVELGEKVFVSVRLSTAPIAGEAPPRLAVYGKVVRIEPKVDGTYGVAQPHFGVFNLSCPGIPCELPNDINHLAQSTGTDRFST